MQPTQPQISASALRTKKSMPDMKTLHTQAPRLTTHASNGNIREGYATIASPSRRSPGGFGNLFGGTNVFNGNGSSSSVPPVPTLPSSLSTPMGLDAPTSGVVRQPRGPSSGGGFGTRRERQIASESTARGLDTRSHEPLEI